MAQRPLIGNKKIIAKKMSPKGVRKSLSPKEKKEKVGTFEHSARREHIVKKEKKAEKGVLRCTRCGSVYFDKHWHGKAVLKGFIKPEELVDALCDACASQVRDVGTIPAGHAGVVFITGISTPERKNEVITLIRSISNRAQKKDPNERVLRIDEKAGKLSVYVSENQLAVSLGKQLHSAMKGGTLTITWSEVDKPVRVEWLMKK